MWPATASSLCFYEAMEDFFFSAWHNNYHILRVRDRHVKDHDSCDTDSMLLKSCIRFFPDKDFDDVPALK